MSITYATYSEFTLVHSLQGITQAEINSHWLPQGALRVNESLGGIYTTPFSDNNMTAKSLSIDYAYLEILQTRTRKQDDSEEMLKKIKSRITDITCFGKPMMTDSADAIFPTGPEHGAWSPVQAHNPVFDMRDSIEQRVDPDYLDALDNRDTD
mgnify:CR=1 FL=1|jgi:hypothetical protein|tara:strand:- start:1841 stop:2299 length:459 start_codon:yes stop_codon:yes gene_type:complete